MGPDSGRIVRSDGQAGNGRELHAILECCARTAVLRKDHLARDVSYHAVNSMGVVSAMLDCESSEFGGQ